jgi:hypothetical protein
LASSIDRIPQRVVDSPVIEWGREIRVIQNVEHLDTLLDNEGGGDALDVAFFEE